MRLEDHEQMNAEGRDEGEADRGERMIEEKNEGERESVCVCCVRA